MLDVCDTGIGIQQALVPHVFELFTQAERTPDRTQGGLGIGLALVKSLVELHGGQVTCKSAGIGKGSQFTVMLPRLLVQSAPEEGQYDPHPAFRSGKKLRILVVDDNQEAARTRCLYLKAQGHAVFAEHSAGQGLVRAQSEAPDVCLLDLGLPDFDGINQAYVHGRNFCFPVLLIGIA